MIKIRTASLKDVKNVSRLVGLGVEEGALLLRTGRELRTLARKDNIIAAFDGDRLVGMVVLDFYSKRMAEMRSLYVIQEYRDTGTGRRLVERLMRRAKTLGVKELMTITLRGKKEWFVRRGFGEDPHGFKVALFREL